MITEFYTNPNKPVAPPATTHNYMTTAANGFGQSHNEYWAKKKGCTVEQFVERDLAYKRQSARCGYNINQVVYPYTWAEYQKKGKCRILKIDRSYQMSDLEWEDKSPLFLVEAITENNEYHIFRATPGFFQLVPPIEPGAPEEGQPE